MKKIIKILVIAILFAILALIIIFVFNPLDLRTKLIGSILNGYLGSNIENYTPLKDNVNSDAQTEDGTADKNPLLNESQEKTLENFGVNIEQLPKSITPAMEECFIEKLGKTRADEIAAGDTPSVIEFFKAKDCIGK